MKKLFTLALLALGMVASAQISLTYQNHGLFDGKTNQMKLTEYMNPGNAGANQVWDFSSLKMKKDFTGHVEDINFSELQTKFPEANVVLDEFGNKFLFNCDEQKIEHIGYSSRSGFSSIKYDEPLMKMKFPFTYGEELAGPIHGTYYLKEEASAKINGSYEVIADGYGQLHLPGAIHIKNALRLKTTKKYTQSRSNSSFDVETITYRWYAENMRYPVLVFIESKTFSKGKEYKSYTAAYNQNYVEFMNSEATEEISDGVSVNLYPNPVTENFTVAFTIQEEANIQINVLSENGALLGVILNENRYPGFYEENFSVKSLNLKTGIYFIKTKVGTNENVKRISVLN